MKALGVDVQLSAPQKGWTGPPCAALVMMSERAVGRLAETKNTSFSCDLGAWHGLMKTYLDGGQAYHTTLPTEGLMTFRDVIRETQAFGIDKVKTNAITLGKEVSELL